MNENKVEPILMQIKRIKQLSFFIDESFRPPQLKSTVQLDFLSRFNLERKILDFTIKVTYLESETKKTFIQSEVQTVFEIKNIEKFIDEKNTPDLPSNVLITLVGICISHARAVLATSTSGTLFNDMILPLMDTVAIAKQFFGDKIKVNEPTLLKTGITASNASDFAP